MPTYVPPEHEGVQALSHAVAHETGRRPAYGAFPAWTDASLLHGHGGIPAVIFGPGSIRKANAADEYVPLDELFASAKTYRRFASDFLEHPPDSAAEGDP